MSKRSHGLLSLWSDNKKSGSPFGGSIFNLLGGVIDASYRRAFSISLMYFSVWLVTYSWSLRMDLPLVMLSL